MKFHCDTGCRDSRYVSAAYEGSSDKNVIPRVEGEEQNTHLHHLVHILCVEEMAAVPGFNIPDQLRLVRLSSKLVTTRVNASACLWNTLFLLIVKHVSRAAIVTHWQRSVYSLIQIGASYSNLYLISLYV